MINYIKRNFLEFQNFVVFAVTKIIEIIKKIARVIWLMLSHQGTPLGVTVALFFLTACGTYYLTPKLNQTFEKQRIVSAYVTENLNNFNSISRDLISEISVFTNQLSDGEKPDVGIKEKIRAKITELQWRAIELDIIFGDTQSAQVINNYKKSLDTLRASIEVASTQDGANDVIQCAAAFTESSVQVIDALARKAGLKKDIEE